MHTDTVFKVDRVDTTGSNLIADHAGPQTPDQTYNDRRCRRLTPHLLPTDDAIIGEIIPKAVIEWMRAPARQYKLSCGGEQYSAHTSGALRYFTFGGSGCAESRTTRVYSLSLEKAQALYLSSSSQKLKKKQIR